MKCPKCGNETHLVQTMTLSGKKGKPTGKELCIECQMGLQGSNPVPKSPSILIKATDSAGNEYIKEATVKKLPRYMGKGEYKDTVAISFGWPCEYCLEDLIYGGDYSPQGWNKEPMGLCIDMGGRNHKGVGNVTISKEELFKALQWAVNQVKEQFGVTLPEVRRI